MDKIRMETRSVTHETLVTSRSSQRKINNERNDWTSDEIVDEGKEIKISAKIWHRIYDIAQRNKEQMKAG